MGLIEALALSPIKDSRPFSSRLWPLGVVGLMGAYGVLVAVSRTRGRRFGRGHVNLAPIFIILLIPAPRFLTLALTGMPHRPRKKEGAKQAEVQVRINANDTYDATTSHIF